MSIYVTLSYQIIDKLSQPLDYLYGYFDEDVLRLCGELNSEVIMNRGDCCEESNCG